MRRSLLVVATFVAVLAVPRRASANCWHGGGSGGGGDPDADCVRWEAVPVTDAGEDAGNDGGSVDAGPWDGGQTDGGATVLRCVEHAKLFGCSLGGPPAEAAAPVAFLALARRRRRNRARSAR